MGIRSARTAGSTGDALRSIQKILDRLHTDLGNSDWFEIVCIPDEKCSPIKVLNAITAFVQCLAENRIPNGRFYRKTCALFVDEAESVCAHIRRACEQGESAPLHNDILGKIQSMIGAFHHVLGFLNDIAFAIEPCDYSIIGNQVDCIWPKHS